MCPQLRLHDKVTSMASGGGDNELANYLVKTYAVAGDDAVRCSGYVCVLRCHCRATNCGGHLSLSCNVTYTASDAMPRCPPQDFTSTVALPPLHGIKRLKATTRAVYIGRKWKTAGYDHRDVFLGLPAVKKLAGLSSHQESDVRELSQNLDSWYVAVLLLYTKRLPAISYNRVVVVVVVACAHALAAVKLR